MGRKKQTPEAQIEEPLDLDLDIEIGENTVSLEDELGDIDIQEMGTKDLINVDNNIFQGVSSAITSGSIRKSDLHNIASTVAIVMNEVSNKEKVQMYIKLKAIAEFIESAIKVAKPYATDAAFSYDPRDMSELGVSFKINGGNEKITSYDFSHDFDWKNIQAKIDQKEQDVKNIGIEIKSLKDQLKVREKFLIKYVDQEFQGEGGVMYKGAIKKETLSTKAQDIVVTIPA